MRSTPILSSTSWLALLLAAACGSGASVAPTPPPMPAPVSIRPAPAIPDRGPVELTEAEVRAIAELLLLEDRRTFDATRIGELMGHWSPEVRRRAALAAGRIGDRSAAPLLLQATRDSAAAVVIEAVFALGELADSSATATRVLARLVQEHPDDSVGVEAVSALGKLDRPAAWAAIRDVLIDRSPGAGPGPGIVKREALLAFWRFPGIRDAIDVVSPYLGSADAETRWRAVYAFVRPGVANALPLLFPLMEDTEPAVRALAVRLMRASVADSAGEHQRALAAILTALRDPAPAVRINALAALATYEADSLAVRALPALDDADGNVRVAAAQALGRLGGAAAMAALQSTSTDGSERFGVRVASLTALAAVDAEAASRVAMAWSQSDRWLERMHAARTFAVLPWRGVGEPVMRLARDSDSRVAGAAYAAIARNADTTATAYALYVEGLRARDPRVRAAAISGVGRRKLPANLTALMDAYDQARNETDNAAALASVDALAELRSPGLPVESAFFARFPPSTDVQVHERVRRRFSRTWELAPAREERGAGFYEEIVRTYVVPEMAGREPPHLLIGARNGNIDIRLAAADAPLTVHNMVTLIGSGYFNDRGDADSRRWHRVVPDFVLQDGDPRGDGSGNPGYAIRDEINRRRYGRGALGMALSGPDTGGSQFFITHSAQPHLDGGYTIFGAVVTGMEAADDVIQDDRIPDMRVIRP